jgi:predicted DNA-binding protein YlxM (UPF0122 family)
MTANRHVLNHKLDAVIAEYSQKENIPLRESLDIFYKSDLYLLITNGVSDIHCRSNAYLAEELKLELIQKSEEQNQIDEKIKNADKEFFALMFVKEFYKTFISLPKYVEQKTGKKCTPYSFFKVMVSSAFDSFKWADENIQNLIFCIDRQISLDVSFEEIAEKIEVSPQDVAAFYEKYKHFEN